MNAATFPEGVVLVKVDYGDAAWREPLPGEANDARVDCGYLTITTDGSSLWLKFDYLQEVEMGAKGARKVADALIAYANMVDRQ